MQHKAVRMGHQVRLELIREGLQVKLANHYTIRGVQYDGEVLIFFPSMWHNAEWMGHPIRS